MLITKRPGVALGARLTLVSNQASAIIMPEDTSNDQPKKPRKAKTRRLIEGRPLCCGASMAKNGIENGKQCYVCTICGKTARDNPSKVGKPPLGEKAMTNAERQRRYKAKKKNQKED